MIPIAQHLSRSLDETIARRVEFLTDYQDAAYAARYRALVDRVRAGRSRRAASGTKLAEAVARYYFKLMAYKDEYEVARLYTDREFMQRLQGDVRGRLHAQVPPRAAAARQARPGHRRAAQARVRSVDDVRVPGAREAARACAARRSTSSAAPRSGAWSAQLIADYERTVEELLARLDRDNHAPAVAIAGVPDEIRGFGHVKAASLKQAKAKEAELLAAFRSPAPSARAA